MASTATPPAPATTPVPPTPAPASTTSTQVPALAVISAVLTLVVAPLIIDWTKRRWDYITGVTKAKFDVLAELNSLLWNYHSACSRLYSLTYPSIIKGRTEEDIGQDVKMARAELLAASNALYTGLYSYQSKIQQYYDQWKVTNARLERLIDWVFHDPDQAMDDHYIQLAQKDSYTNPEMREMVVEDLRQFRQEANLILQSLATELRAARSFWYPVSRLPSR
jgi:hypothetical protein